MDHLQGSMVNAAAGRKEEIEDMQQELVDLTATTARQERELGALRMKLEEKHLAHEAEVCKLHEQISKLEVEKAQYEGHRNAHDLQMSGSYPFANPLQIALNTVLNISSPRMGALLTNNPGITNAPEFCLA